MLLCHVYTIIIPPNTTVYPNVPAFSYHHLIHSIFVEVIKKFDIKFYNKLLLFYSAVCVQEHC
jgi:hypothetical protein